MSIYFKYIIDSSNNQIFVPLENIFKGGATQEPYYTGMPPFVLKTRTIENQNNTGFLDATNNDISTKYTCFFIDYEYTTDTSILNSRQNIAYPAGLKKMKVFITGAGGAGGTSDAYDPEGIVQGGGAGGSGSLLYFEYTPSSASTGYSLVVGRGGRTAGTAGTITTFSDLETPTRINTVHSGTGAKNANNNNNDGGIAGYNTATFGTNITNLNGFNGAEGGNNNSGANYTASRYQQNGIYNGSFFPANLTYSGRGGRGADPQSENNNIIYEISFWLEQGNTTGWRPGEDARIRVYFEY